MSANHINDTEELLNLLNAFDLDDYDSIQLDNSTTNSTEFTCESFSLT